MTKCKCIEVEGGNMVVGIGRMQVVVGNGVEEDWNCCCSRLGYWVEDKAICCVSAAKKSPFDLDTV